jgi:hypothetical protein
LMNNSDGKQCSFRSPKAPKDDKLVFLNKMKHGLRD